MMDSAKGCLATKNHAKFGDQIWRQNLTWGRPSPEALGPILTEIPLNYYMEASTRIQRGNESSSNIPEFLAGHPEVYKTASQARGVVLSEDARFEELLNTSARERAIFLRYFIEKRDFFFDCDTSATAIFVRKCDRLQRGTCVCRRFLRRSRKPAD